MKYKDFYSHLFEAYPWGGYDATDSDFAAVGTQTDAPDDNGEINVSGVRVSDALGEEVVNNLKKAISEYRRWKQVKEGK